MRDFAFTGGRPDPGTFPTQELIANYSFRKLVVILLTFGEDNLQLRELASLRSTERDTSVPRQHSTNLWFDAALDLIFRAYRTE